MTGKPSYTLFRLGSLEKGVFLVAVGNLPVLTAYQ